MVSLVGLAGLLKINYNIAHLYEMSGEKTREVFGLVELGFIYKYSIGVFGFLAIILSVMAFRSGEKKQWVNIAVVISVITFLATFVKIWKVMV